jgi:hypothetical protein
MIRLAGSDKNELANFENEIINLLGGDASDDIKNELCRELSIWGSEASLPALEKLMDDEDTREMARFAKERITGDYSN